MYSYFWLTLSPFIFNSIQFFDMFINLVTNSIKYGTSRIKSPCQIKYTKNNNYLLKLLIPTNIMWFFKNVNVGSILTLLFLYCGEILMSKKLSFPEVTSNFFIKSRGIFSLGFNLCLTIWFKHNDLFVNIRSLVLRLYPLRSNFTTLAPYYKLKKKIIFCLFYFLIFF